MKFSCEKALLLSAITITSKVASSKSAIPALEGLLLEASRNLQISGYDLKTGIKTEIPADVEEIGDIIVNARLFGEIIRKLPDDAVYITADERNTILIESGQSQFTVMGTPASDYPELPFVDTQNSIYIRQKTLKAMISECIFAVSDNESRPIQTGTLFEVENKTLTMVSVDGYRLALRREKIDNSDFESCSFVVPGTALSEVEKIASESEEMVTITIGTKHILFVIGDTILVSRRLEGEFLNYRQAIPPVNKIFLDINTKDIIESVERVSLIISDKLKSPVKCIFGDGIMQISAVTAIGKATDECRIGGDGENLEIGFNNKYLLDALKAAPSDKVKILLNTNISPCIIGPADEGDNFIYMVLPIRMRAGD